ncbi:hypothetical protein BDZ45DRAFT_757729 [Acephala macrosclerotiorum]|nr:hypothetical protein BDZ45DRAFT_757729 [Acephala macrosclerotiorum]
MQASILFRMVAWTLGELVDYPSRDPPLQQLVLLLIMTLYNPLLDTTSSPLHFATSSFHLFNLYYCTPQLSFAHSKKGFKMPPPQFYHKVPRIKKDIPAQDDSLSDRSAPQGSTTNIGQDQSAFQSQNANAQPREEKQGMTASSYDSQAATQSQSNTSNSQPPPFESGGIYWLKKKGKNSTYTIFELLKNGHRHEYSDDGCLRPVVVLRPETGYKGHSTVSRSYLIPRYVLRRMDN